VSDQLDERPVPPSAAVPGAPPIPVVGMVGAGQLARMTCPAATQLSVGFRVLAASARDSAALVWPHVQLGDHRSLDDLRRFASGCDVVTFDHEHVPGPHLRALEEAGAVVRPGAAALRFTQDKLAMRERLTGLGVPCPRYAPVAGLPDIEAFAAATGNGGPGWPVVLKAISGGYDGKGVWVCGSPGEAAEVVGLGLPLMAEQHVAFDRELAALIARSPHNQGAAYPVVETVQRDGICREVIAPAPGLAPDRAEEAQALALRIASELDVTGLLAVELFDTPGGLLVNELAMRPHNTGHWSIDGAHTSQFENHLRAVLDLPLGDPRPRAKWTVMVNVLGGDYPDMYSAYLHCMARDPQLKIHMYGKDVKPGRKVGHVNTYGDDLDDVLERARHAAGYLRGTITE
jgi:5-(carboxyamino)imidazole ribonucleotide synthase